MKKFLSITALLVAVVLVTSGVTMALNQPASAENVTKTVVTSPFTEAIAQVRDSVVGVSNYQTVRYSNSNPWGSWGDYFGFGDSFGFGGRGYGDGRGNSETQSQEVLAGTGSGTVIAEHYVLTNHHVVEDASSLKITVAKDGSDEPDTYSAVLVAEDENLDIAIVYAPDLPLQPVQLGDSDTLQIGDWAICIGNPLGIQFSGTVTTGIVSALNRAVSSTNYDIYGRRETVTNAMIQTDAAINNGNSGGGMFSVTGELMGVPTLKYSGSAYSGATIEGIGMCIPINAAKPLIEDVLSGKITTPAVTETEESAATEADSNSLVGKPRLGVTISGLNPSSSAIQSGAIPNGVYVTEVEEGGPAADAGMEQYDIIVDVDGEVISGVNQLREIIAGHGEGDTLKVKVYRVPGGLGNIGQGEKIPDGEYVDLEVTLTVVDEVKQ